MSPNAVQTPVAIGAFIVLNPGVTLGAWYGAVEFLNVSGK
jgi:hypothetical protein